MGWGPGMSMFKGPQMLPTCSQSREAALKRLGPRLHMHTLSSSIREWGESLHPPLFPPIRPCPSPWRGDFLTKVFIYLIFVYKFNVIPV